MYLQLFDLITTASNIVKNDIIDQSGEFYHIPMQYLSNYIINYFTKSLLLAILLKSTYEVSFIIFLHNIYYINNY